MMRKVYTAQEMRETSAIISRLHIVDRTTCGEYSARIKDKLRSMLRQSADAMEHNESLLRKAGELSVGLMNKMNAQHEEIKKLRGMVVLLASALSRATVLRCVEADGGIPCKDLLDDDSCGAENCKSMCGRWRELIDKAKKEVKDA